MDRTALASAVSPRRKALGLTQGGVKERGGPGQSLLSSIENGRDVPLSDGTLIGLDVALDWPIGTAQSVLDGGDPPTLSTGVAQADLDAIMAKLDEVAATRQDVANLHDVVLDLVQAVGRVVERLGPDPEEPR